MPNTNTNECTHPKPLHAQHENNNVKDTSTNSMKNHRHTTPAVLRSLEKEKETTTTTTTTKCDETIVWICVVRCAVAHKCIHEHIPIYNQTHIHGQYKSGYRSRRIVASQNRALCLRVFIIDVMNRTVSRLHWYGVCLN